MRDDWETRTGETQHGLFLRASRLHQNLCYSHAVLCVLGLLRQLLALRRVICHRKRRVWRLRVERGCENRVRVSPTQMRGCCVIR